MRNQTCGVSVAYFMSSAPYPLLSQPKTSTLWQLRYITHEMLETDIRTSMPSHVVNLEKLRTIVWPSSGSVAA